MKNEEGKYKILNIECRILKVNAGLKFNVLCFPLFHFSVFHFSFFISLPFAFMPRCLAIKKKKAACYQTASLNILIYLKLTSVSPRRSQVTLGLRRRFRK